MDITDLLARMGGLESIARELGISEQQAARGAAALAPAILGGFKREARAQPTGVEGLGSLLEQLGGGALLDEVLAPQPTDAHHGDDVLGQIFGSKDVSRAVAQNAAAQSGVDASLLRRMLPLVAMLVAGYLAKQRGAAGTAQGAPSSGGGLGELVGDLLGGGTGGVGRTPSGGGAATGLGALLDLDGDGNPLDDILRLVGKAMR